jgi:hypothetical protein
MALNQREKYLAGGVGALVVLFIGQSIVKSVQSSLNDKRTTITRLKSKIDEDELKVLAGAVASDKLFSLKTKSLSRNEEAARADYTKWLISLADQNKLEEPTPRFLGESPDKDPFHLYRFQLTGIGNIEQATQLLHAFYKSNFLHRITRFDLKPISNGKEPDKINISLDCEVLALSIARDKQPLPKEDTSRLAKSLDEYKFSIMERNLFSPANNPPALEPNKVVEATAGLRFEHSIDAKDLDTLQKMTYEIVGEAPKGLTVDKSTGKLAFTSKDVGTYKVDVKATDSGIPSRSAFQSLMINVKEPKAPKEEIKFDVASQSFVTALLSGRDGPEAWVESKTETKTYHLRKGDTLKLGGVEGKVTEIGQNYMELETSGRKWTVALDETLADAYTRSQTD